MTEKIDTTTYDEPNRLSSLLGSYILKRNEIVR